MQHTKFVLLDEQHCTSPEDWAALYSVFVDMEPVVHKGRLAALLGGARPTHTKPKYELQFMQLCGTSAQFVNMIWGLEKRIRIQYEQSYLFGRTSFSVAFLPAADSSSQSLLTLPEQAP